MGNDKDLPDEIQSFIDRMVSGHKELLPPEKSTRMFTDDPRPYGTFSGSFSLDGSNVPEWYRRLFSGLEPPDHLTCAECGADLTDDRGHGRDCEYWGPSLEDLADE